MDTRRYGEVSVLHIEPATYTKLLHLADAVAAANDGQDWPSWRFGC